MIIQLLSDVHMEFRDYDWDIPDIESDLIILAGDIGNQSDGFAWAEQQQQKLGKRIIYIPGNHDYYGTDIDFIKRKRGAYHKLYPNLYDNETVTIDGIKFICSTLWTDYDLYHKRHKAMDACLLGMMDHRAIRHSIENRNFKPADALKLHKEAMEFLSKELSTIGTKVVVTHHCPTFQAIAKQWLGDACNPGFTSDLEGFMAQHSPALWVCGHVHSGFQHRVFDTLIVANPLGYPKELATTFNPNLTIEIKKGKAQIHQPWEEHIL
jgi:predicted phosphodiesterase